MLEIKETNYCLKIFFYRALAAAACEIQWLTYLLKDLNLQDMIHAVLYCDNQSTRYISSNLIFHERTKHIEIDCHIVREKLQANLFHLLPITSKQQLVDVFTKTLEPKLFIDIVNKLGIMNIHDPT